MSFDAFTVSDKGIVQLFLAKVVYMFHPYSPKDINHSPTLGCRM